MRQTIGFESQAIARLRERLDHHPVYALGDLDALRRFMEHHVYSVWDFMSLIKYLQAHLAPVGQPWVPTGDGEVRRFINELVLEEESDAVPGPDGQRRHMSHFELYCEAMAEVGADAERPRRFVAIAAEQGVESALASGLAPEASVRFMRTTFGFIASGKPHVVGAALALGREQVIPGMFRGLLHEMGIGVNVAPQFHFYLQRHIDLDGDSHGPLSLRMLDQLCAGDRRRMAEAREAARVALEARIAFWDGVQGGLREAA